MELTGLKTTAQLIRNVISKNAPTLLTAIAVTGVVTTIGTTIRGTTKAHRILEAIREEALLNNEEAPVLTPWEVFKETWACYIPTLIIGGVTVACIIGSNSVHLRRSAALASAYSITEAALKEYQAKVVETLGENKARKVKDDIAKDRIDHDPVSTKEVIVTGRGETLCYDVMSSRYFKSDIEKIRRLENELNHQLIREMFVSQNEFYYEIGLPSVKMGDELGWDVEQGLIEFDYSAQLAEDKTPCLVIDYVVKPRYHSR